MKIFISQPMQNKTDAEILAERERTIKAAKAKWGDDVEALESFFQGAPTEAKPLWFLGESLKVMADANAVIVCKGWSDARWVQGGDRRRRCVQVAGFLFDRR